MTGAKSDVEVLENGVGKFPQFYYAKHMQPGLCGYKDEKVLVNTDAMKRMLPSLNGKPIYIHHQKADLQSMKEKASGYVVESFYNGLDGWGWSKVMIIDDDGHQAIAEGWAPSNAYIPTEFTSGGEHNNIPYTREITNGEFTHLAEVPSPRYEGAKFYTPDEFKRYQATKRAELDELTNAKPENENPQEKGPTMKLFRNEKKEVTTIDADTLIELKNAKGETEEVKVADMVAALEAKKAAELELKNTADNDKKLIKVGDEEITIGELKNRYEKLAADELKNSGETDEEKAAREAAEAEAAKEADELKNAADVVAAAKKKAFDELRNANLKKGESQIIDLGLDQAKRGAELYGSQA